MDVTDFKGKTVTFEVREATNIGISMIVQSDEIPGFCGFYSEALRPQFHFSQMIGWNNDHNPTAWFIITASGTSSSSITPMAGTGEICTGGMPSAKTCFIGSSFRSLFTIRSVMTGPGQAVRL